MSANVIQGNPTKTFFIEMITRDISIKDAILDLLDNSIDGANKINHENYSGLQIEIFIDKDSFIVKDNCGGFSLETAQKYAFRFGRPDDAPDSRGSVGRFGIGMKRALFKIGEAFEIESKTANDHFQVSVDVEKWRDRKKKIKFEDEEIEVEDWDFTYEYCNQENSNINVNGTYVAVTNLYPEVAELFEENEFLVDLKDDIERLLNFSLEKNIAIYLNGEKLQGKNIQIFYDESKPYFYEGEKDGVRFRIVAGLGEVGKPAASGWYIYCNDRLVLEADRTEITGWGTGSIPRNHIDHVMFRGLVFMDSDDTLNLPLTTTKKGIDATSDIYKTVLVFMKEAMSRIIPFLKLVTKLGNEANEYRKLLGDQEEKISVVEAKNKDFSKAVEVRTFKAPEVDTEKIAVKRDSVRIQYDLNLQVANRAKLHSQTKSYTELGLYTMGYYLKMEELDE